VNDLNQADEEILSTKVSDDALEAVADNQNAFTFQFCSGLETCSA
jgi:hypothetical protein